MAKIIRLSIPKRPAAAAARRDAAAPGARIIIFPGVRYEYLRPRGRRAAGQGRRERG